MARADHVAQDNQDLTEVLDAAGIEITDQGRQKARAQLDEAARRLTPQKREQLRRIGTSAA